MPHAPQENKPKENAMLHLTLPDVDQILSAMHMLPEENRLPGLMERITAERDRLADVAARVAQAAANQAKRQANLEYVTNEIKRGDVVEYSIEWKKGQGRNFTSGTAVRRMRVESAELWRDRFGKTMVNLTGVVLKKDGTAPGKLNSPWSGTKREYGVSPADVTLITP